MLISLALNLFFFQSNAAAGTKEQKLAAQVKAGIEKLGTGKDSIVKVKLKDKSRIRGYVSEIDDDGFSVVSDKDGTVTEVQYQNVKQVKGNNLSKKTGIVIGVLLVITLFVVAMSLSFRD